MSIPFDREPMMDMYIFETTQLLEQLESALLNYEKERSFKPASINEIFRIMHTIKGSSAMMLFNEISSLAHKIEDLFYYLREHKPEVVDFSTLSDLMLNCVDFIKVETDKIKNREEADGTAAGLIRQLADFLVRLKGDQNGGVPFSAPMRKSDAEVPKLKPFEAANKPAANTYQVVLYFDEDGMENIRAFAVIHKLREWTDDYSHEPADLIQNESANIIRNNGFFVTLRSEREATEIHGFFESTLFLRRLDFSQLAGEAPAREHEVERNEAPVLQEATYVPSVSKSADHKPSTTVSQQTIISVSIQKLDLLMDLVGELVISEAMVTQNPELKGLQLESFYKAARQHRKITGDLQNVVMSIRMVPLAQSFHKMNRIVRDMSRKLEKDVELVIIGEETEVDKNIIEHISDPLMHLIRNSLDHGLEPPEERRSKGKPEPATVTLEARNEGGEVLILVRDNGRGLNKTKILEKATQNGLIHKPQGEMTDGEIYSLIFLPGFSTKDSVSEFSGRGVGMDVVTRNIEAIGGTISVNSQLGEGTTITLKIPLTLAIVNGINIKVGDSQYTIPTTTVKESFRTSTNVIFSDPAGNEMLMVRGQCYPLIRICDFYKVRPASTLMEDGIVIMVESGSKTVCLFADELLGEHQAVVKVLPPYIKNRHKIRGITGCTLLGDGSVSLILDVAGFIS